MSHLGIVGLLGALTLGSVAREGREARWLRFPPYRSTDAETADPWTLEGRLGLVQIERAAQQTNTSSPLIRLNFGLPGNVELLSEFEYRADESRVGDAAIGFKWVPLFRSVSVGLETLALLPLPQEGGAGIESTFLTTIRYGVLRVHVNAGAFYDSRPAQPERGWKSGVIGEARLGRLRPGVELFAKRVRSEPVEMSAGPGVIADVGPFDVRTGLDVGLTRTAPDLRVSLWVTSKFRLR